MSVLASITAALGLGKKRDPAAVAMALHGRVAQAERDLAAAQGDLASAEREMADLAKQAYLKGATPAGIDAAAAAAIASLKSRVSMIEAALIDLRAAHSEAVEAQTEAEIAAAAARVCDLADRREVALVRALAMALQGMRMACATGMARGQFQAELGALAASKGAIDIPEGLDDPELAAAIAPQIPSKVLDRVDGWVESIRRRPLGQEHQLAALALAKGHPADDAHLVKAFAAARAEHAQANRDAAAAEQAAYEARSAPLLEAQRTAGQRMYALSQKPVEDFMPADCLAAAEVATGRVLGSDAEYADTAIGAAQRILEAVQNALAMAGKRAVTLPSHANWNEVASLLPIRKAP